MERETIPQLLRRQAARYPDVVAQLARPSDGGPFAPRTYRQLAADVERFAAGLTVLGVGSGSHIGLIAENRVEWLVTDLAVLSLRAADVPRGNDSTADELRTILGLPECRVVVVENATQGEKVLSVVESLPDLAHVIVMDDGELAAPSSVTVHRWIDVLASGDAPLASTPTLVSDAVDAGDPDDLATIIFTSGTTGQPKGVMLTHQNFRHQVGCAPDRIATTPGDVWLCVLPVWHSFERVSQYITMFTAGTLAYSKPIGKIMLRDMAEVHPRWMASVPRIWEAIRQGIYRNAKAGSAVKYAIFRFFVAVGGAHKSLQDLFRGRVPDFERRNRLVDSAVAVVPLVLLWPLRMLGNVLVFGKIKERLGGSFIAGVSAGGALPPAVDRFFGAAGILLLEGYGLTETAPVLSVRSQYRPVPGTVGELIRDTECRIVGEDGTDLGPGRTGVIHVRGPQVMQGYYKRPDATAEVLSDDGWLNTGDLGMISHRGELKITGRAKDTIVLLGGENIEPVPIEQRLQESEYIERAVVVGQDQKYLGALIIPDRIAVEQYATTNHIPFNDVDDLLTDDSVRELLDGEINTLVNARTGFKSFELIYRFQIVTDDFEIGRELSAKQEIKRHVIAERYAIEIAALFVT